MLCMNSGGYFFYCTTFHLLTLMSSLTSLLNIMRLFCHSPHPIYAFAIMINSVSLQNSPHSSPSFPRHLWAPAFPSEHIPAAPMDPWCDYSSHSVSCISPNNLGEALLLLHNNSASLILFIYLWKLKLISLSQHCLNDPFDFSGFP